MKNEYENLEIEIIAFEATDVILTSDDPDDDTNNEGYMDG